MTAQQIRSRFIEYQRANGHVLIERALVVPSGSDTTTLFTSSGMQQLVPYLLGKEHPDGKRLTDVQTCIRAQDIESVGDNRHTTYFEMLGNWSLGDYFKKEQIPWIFNFLIDDIGLDPNRLYVTCYAGNQKYKIPKDTESAKIWSDLFNARGVSSKQVDLGNEQNGYKVGTQEGRIFYYQENWWSRGSSEEDTPIGDPCGPDSEMMYEFPQVEHNKDYGEFCHPACDCGRYLEIGNSVFMAYRRTEKGFSKLDKPNVDFGGGLERIASAQIDSPDIFKISLLWPLIQSIESKTNKQYIYHKSSMRVIADHLRAACFMALDGIIPSNKEQGYIMRRLVRRATRFGLDLGIHDQLCQIIVPLITELYKQDFPEMFKKQTEILVLLDKEERSFRNTLKQAVAHFDEIAKSNNELSGQDIFLMKDRYGMPVELTLEEAKNKNIKLDENWRNEFDKLLSEQKLKSQKSFIKFNK